MKTYLLILLLTVSSAFCMAPRISKDERISQGVHGSSLAIERGRIDIADKLISDTKKIVIPPKKPLNVEQIPGKVILPERLTGDVVRISSKEHKLLLEDRKIKKAYEEGEKEWKKYSESVDKTLRQQKKDQDQLQANFDAAKEKIKALVVYRNIIWGGIIGLISLATVVGIWFVFRIAASVR